MRLVRQRHHLLRTLSIRDRSAAAAAVEATFSTSANFKRNASSSAPWISNADDNSTRSFSDSARSASQAVYATYNASLASSCASVHSALNAD
jgi:hypothetical protein